MPPVFPDAVDIAVESLLPHRGRMLLVGRILAADDHQVTVLSEAHDSWPLCTDGDVNPLMLIELLAQTAGVHNGLVRMQRRGRPQINRGWLVGIKKAVLHVPAVRVGTRITTISRNAFVFENLREIEGTAFIDDRIVAEAGLQLVEAESLADQG